VEGQLEHLTAAASGAEFRGADHRIELMRDLKR